MTVVKNFLSSMVGAPVLSGTAGSLISVLDAVLVNGFNAKAVESLVVADGVATLSFGTAHGFADAAVLRLEGVPVEALNGEKRIVASTPMTITVAAPQVANQTLTGAITVKVAPAGWDKVFSATNLAVYRSADITGTRAYLRVDDSGATNARLVGYETMSQVSVGRKPFPTDGQLSGGVYVPKSTGSGSTARGWTVVADSKTLYLHTNTAAVGAAGAVWAFGDFASLRSGDPYAAMIQGGISDLTNDGGARSESVEYFSAASGVGAFVARAYTGLGSAVNCVHGVESYATAAGASGATSSAVVPSYPNGPDNSLVLTRKLLIEPGIALRGFYRGLLVTPQQCHAAFAHGDVVDGTGPYAERQLMAVKCGGVSGNTSRGVVFFDITGPWE